MELGFKIECICVCMYIPPLFLYTIDVEVDIFHCGFVIVSIVHICVKNTYPRTHTRTKRHRDIDTHKTIQPKCC